MAQTGKWLRSVVQGYFNYHAVPGNLDSLLDLSGSVDPPVATRNCGIAANATASTGPPASAGGPLAALPRVLHPWPSERFAASHPR